MLEVSQTEASGTADDEVEDRPASGITAIFDSQSAGRLRCELCAARCLLLHRQTRIPHRLAGTIHEVAALTAYLTAYPWQSLTRQDTLWHKCVKPPSTRGTS